VCVFPGLCGGAAVATLACVDGHRLIRLGASLFVAALLIGFAIPQFAVPRLALSAHLIGLMQGLFLMTVGLLAGRLRLGPRAARAAFALLVYGCTAALAANLVAAATGAGHLAVPMATGDTRAAPSLEFGVMLVLRSAGVSLITATALVSWGLRHRSTS